MFHFGVLTIHAGAFRSRGCVGKAALSQGLLRSKPFVASLTATA
jgi:hypothetical protein